MDAFTIHKQIDIDAPIERVWGFVGTQVGSQKWRLPDRVTFEERVGGRFEEHVATGRATTFRLVGRVVTYEPPHRIEMTARKENEDGSGWPAETLISITVIERPGGARVTVTHSGFERLPPEDRDAEVRTYEGGWERMVRRLATIAPPLESKVAQRIRAATTAVFRALIDPAALAAWFCDHAEVDPRPSGVYAFGGPHAYGGPEMVRGRIIALEPNRTLTYIWPLARAETTVAVEVREVSTRETEVAVHHSGVSALPMEWASAEHLTAVWQILLRQLDAHLRGRPLPRYDFSVTPPPVVDQTITIDAPPARVWEMLTVPSQMNRWISTDAYVELQPGGRYSYGWDEEGPLNSGPLRVLAVEPPIRLVISWREAGAIGTVTWRLEPTGQGRSTRLHLVHEGLGAVPGILSDYTIGWWEFLIRLPDLAA
jgi:uncharacterized protein YndB with AHSA1/START domain